MVSIPPGWYPDPVDEYEVRWWDGRQWAEEVRTGRYSTIAPVVSFGVPQREDVVWSDGRYELTTHAAYLLEGRDRVAVPWWSVARVASEVGAVESLSGLGTIVLHIAYPGYTDRSERRLRRVADSEQVAALSYTWSRRHRRASGLP